MNNMQDSDTCNKPSEDPAIPNPNKKTQLENYQFYFKAERNLASCHIYRFLLHNTHTENSETEKANASNKDGNIKNLDKEIIA